ncbi:hypothetical protein G7Z17_g8676 [Cylindrodendrum hubeiense]|uniref:FeS cluster biogenesis domain-containing protein n=1 Tax=Cylindrodendrum hubeiense TaxID=595255 RepID=A0A9P5H609_9HYPO|nr:hypothetical protein G7Z17_g8676 [Cylindrodendrum hubeiense]
MAIIRCSKAPSAARSFLQLAHRSYSSTATQSSTPLEFLFPRCAPLSASRSDQVSAVSTRVHAHARNINLGQLREFTARAPSRRHFSTSSSRQQTRSILNTQTDEDGNEMMLEITPRAAKDANPNLALRIQVESGGCHGFQYLMSLTTLPEKDSPEWSDTINEDDTIFQHLPDDADPSSQSQEGPKIILDEPSLDLLKGSKVDFTMELIGSQFKIVDNPLATSSCGCGTSFDIKM